MINSVIKHGTYIILLTFVIMTSVLRFHHHDCHGHMSFAFSETNECPSLHIHLYADSEAGGHHNQQHFCPIIIEFQASELLESDFGTPLLTAILPHWAQEIFVSDDVECITYDFVPKLVSGLSGLCINLRAPPLIHL